MISGLIGFQVPINMSCKLVIDGKGIKNNILFSLERGVLC